MKIHDNRHLDFSGIIQQGDVVVTDEGNYYRFIAKKDYGYQVESSQMIQVDLLRGEEVNCYADETVKSLRVGEKLYIGGVIKEIFKNENLVLDIRK